MLTINIFTFTVNIFILPADIFTLTINKFVDEINVMERLPIYVAADPDLVPSMRLMEGDLLVLINKLDKIDERCRSLQADLEITRSLTQIRLSGATGAKQGSNIKHGTNVHFQKGHPAVTDSEGVSSARESDCEMDANDAELFITPRTKNDVKRSNAVKKRARESPTAPLFSEIAAKVPSKVVMLGHAVNSSLKASQKLYVSKSVYRLGNVDSDNTADDVKEYIESLDVRVVSCFERTSSNRQNDDNKCFRVCIFTADRAKFLTEENWSVGISIQNWVFQPKNAESDDVEASAAKSLRTSDSPASAVAPSVAPSASAASTSVAASTTGVNVGEGRARGGIN